MHNACVGAMSSSIPKLFTDDSCISQCPIVTTDSTPVSSIVHLDYTLARGVATIEPNIKCWPAELCRI